MSSRMSYKREELKLEDETVVSSEKYLELQSKSINTQMDVFAERFVFDLDMEKFGEAFKIKREFEIAVVRHWLKSPAGGGFDDTASVSNVSVLDTPDLLPEETYLPLTSTQLTWFLERRDKTMMQLHRKTAFEGLLTKQGGIDLIGYLLYHFRRVILVQYYHRRNRKVPKGVTGLTPGKEMGNKEEGFELTIRGQRKTISQALKEELFMKIPFGVDKLLDAGLFQFESIMEPIRKSMFELQDVVDDPNLSPVKHNAAKAEIQNLQRSYEEAYNLSYVKIKVYIDKLKKKQKQTFLDMKNELEHAKKHRQMTLGRFNQ